MSEAHSGTQKCRAICRRFPQEQGILLGVVCLSGSCWQQFGRFLSAVGAFARRQTNIERTGFASEIRKIIYQTDANHSYV